MVLGYLGVAAVSFTIVAAWIARCCGLRGESLHELRTDVLEEFGHDGKAADDDADGEFGIAPEAKGTERVAFVGRYGDLPYVVCAHNGH